MIGKTRIVQSQESLLKSLELCRSVINNISEVVFQINPEGIYIYLNPAWTKITGYPVEETIGTNYVD